MGSVRQATVEEIVELADLAADGQSRGDRFVAYVGDDAATIAIEIAELGQWAGPGVIAQQGERPTGWLQGYVDPELGRVWWWGPFVIDDQWAATADALYVEARAYLGAAIGQEELAFDDRHGHGAAFADRHGFVAETASFLLGIDRATVVAPTGEDRPGVGSGMVVEPLAAEHRPAVASLHDQMFAGAHLTGQELVHESGGRDHRTVALIDGGVVGYVATTLEADGDGLIDFLAVDLELRGYGIGRHLVAHAVEDLRRRGAERCHLTVREDNSAARRLYAGLGFAQDRVLRPFRKGFSMEPG